MTRSVVFGVAVFVASDAFWSFVLYPTFWRDHDQLLVVLPGIVVCAAAGIAAARWWRWWEAADDDEQT